MSLLTFVSFWLCEINRFRPQLLRVSWLQILTECQCLNALNKMLSEELVEVVALRRL